MPHAGDHESIPADTSPAAWQRYVERLRETAPIVRLRRAFALSNQVRALTFASVRRDHPEMADRELRLEFLRRVYGDELATRVAAVWTR